MFSAEGNKDEEVVEEAKDPPEDENLGQALLLCGDYGLGAMVLQPDADTGAPAVHSNVERTVPMFFASRSVVCADGYSEEDPLICLKCPCWNLTALFCLRNQDGWSSWGCCLYLQHARCKYINLAGPS